ncbi:hypothetical protein A0U40_08530 [[Bacillus] sp. KCTC 13219]|nr:hypothetical protein A0U40_08530 [[Bacillus] sp. KCTC 13219]
MPENIINNIKSKVSKRFKSSFLTTFIGGILVHLYVLTNKLPNHDSALSIYFDQDMSISGRFSLQYLAGISSYFDLQWVNGLLAILYLALTVALLIEIFDIKKKLTQILLSALFITFPSVAATFSYMYTADAYMLATTLAVLGVYLLFKYEKGFFISILLFYISLSTYQANLSIIILLILLKFVLEFWKDNLRVALILKSILTMGASLGIYVIHFKIYSIVGDKSLTSYKGINDAGNISFKMILNRIPQTYLDTFNFYFGKLGYQNFFDYLNIVIAVLLVLMLIEIIKRQKKLINFNKISSVVLLVLIFPIITHVIYFMSPGVTYHLLMKHSLVFVYIGILIIYDNVPSTTTNKMSIFNSYVTVLTLSLVAFNFALISNIGYFNLQLKYEKSYALALKVSDRFEQLDNYNQAQRVVVIGSPKFDDSYIQKAFREKTPVMVGINEESLFHYTSTSRFQHFLASYVGVNLQPINITTVDNLTETVEFEEMEKWPSKKSVKIIEDVVFIKFQ